MEDLLQAYLVTPQKYLYAAQDGTHVMTVGVQDSLDMTRIKSYGERTRVYLVRAIERSESAERIMLALFRQKFGPPIIGKETFRCAPEDAMRMFDHAIGIISAENKKTQQAAAQPQQAAAQPPGGPLLVPLVAPLVDEIVYACSKTPMLYRFCCKTFCHKLCYLHYLHKCWQTESASTLKCVCGKSYPKCSIFFAKKIKKMVFNGGYEVDVDGRPQSTGRAAAHSAGLINVLFSEMIRPKCNRGQFSHFADCLDEKVLNIAEYQSWFYPKLRMGYDIDADQKYIIHKTHTVCGPYRYGDIFGEYGQILVDKDAVKYSRGLYKNQIRADTYVILMIDAATSCYGALFDAGMAAGKGAKVIILFDDGVEFPDPIDCKSFDYKEFGYIFAQNYEITPEEQDMIMCIPYLREKFYTYEDYLASLAYYKKKIGLS